MMCGGAVESRRGARRPPKRQVLGTVAHTDHVKSLERAVPFDHLRDGWRGEEHVAGVHKQHALCATLCANPLHKMSEVRETALPVGPGGRKARLQGV